MYGVTFKILNDVKPGIYFQKGTHMSLLANAVEVFARSEQKNNNKIIRIYIQLNLRDIVRAPYQMARKEMEIGRKEIFVK